MVRILVIGSAIHVVLNAEEKYKPAPKGFNPIYKSNPGYGGNNLMNCKLYVLLTIIKKKWLVDIIMVFNVVNIMRSAVYFPRPSILILSTNNNLKELPFI